MISPRSFIYSRRATPGSPSSSSSSSYSPTTTSWSSSRPSPSSVGTSVGTSSPTHSTFDLCCQTCSRQHQPPLPPRQQNLRPSSPDNIANKSSGTIPRRISALKYDERATPCPITVNYVVPFQQQTTTASGYFQPVTMGKRKERLDAAGDLRLPDSISPCSSRPTTPTSPVQIPKNTRRPTAHHQKRLSSPRRMPSHARLPGNISPSVAALLAVTDIPRMGSQRRKRRVDKSLTANEIIDQHQVSEKDFSWTLGRGPMDVLLSPPEEFADDISLATSDCNTGSVLSTRTMSVDSLPSLGDSFVTEGIASVETPYSPSPAMRRRRMSPMRRSLEPLLSPPGEDLDHPLSSKNDDEEPALEPLPESIEEEEASSNLFQQFKPFRYAFTSNLTASIRALRSAAKSFSTINFSSIPSDDFLTRSLLTFDSNIPYTDERRPPVTDDIPSAEVRRYLNPTTSSHVETQLATAPSPRKFAASIQMQTYKVQRSRFNSQQNHYPRCSPQHHRRTQPEQEEEPSGMPTQTFPPALRPREMRENPDFIRIAVMEMAMRRHGKLDDQTPGRARWALPPRKTSTGTYDIGADGVPARWTPISA